MNSNSESESEYEDVLVIKKSGTKAEKGRRKCSSEKRRRKSSKVFRGKKRQKVDEKEGIGKKRSFKSTTRIRNSPGVLSHMVAALSEEQKNWVIEAGFGGLLKLVVTELPHKLCFFLLKSFDDRTCTLMLPCGPLPIVESDVKDIFGLPQGKRRLMLSVYSDDSKLVQDWKAQYKDEKQITATSIGQQVAKSGQVTILFKYNFLVVVYNTLVKCVSNPAVCKDMLGFTDLDRLPEYNWCEAVISSLRYQAMVWKGNTKHRFFNGPLILVLLHYVDRVIFQNEIVVPRTIPLLIGWTDGKLQGRQKAEIRIGQYGSGKIRGSIHTEIASSERMGFPITTVRMKPKMPQLDDEEETESTQPNIKNLKRRLKKAASKLHKWKREYDKVLGMCKVADASDSSVKKIQSSIKNLYSNQSDLPFGLNDENSAERVDVGPTTNDYVKCSSNNENMPSPEINRNMQNENMEQEVVDKSNQQQYLAEEMSPSFEKVVLEFCARAEANAIGITSRVAANLEISSPHCNTVKLGDITNTKQCDTEKEKLDYLQKPNESASTGRNNYGVDDSPLPTFDVSGIIAQHRLPQPNMVMQRLSQIEAPSLSFMPSFTLWSAIETENVGDDVDIVSIAKQAAGFEDILPKAKTGTDVECDKVTNCGVEEIMKKCKKVDDVQVKPKRDTKPGPAFRSPFYCRATSISPKILPNEKNLWDWLFETNMDPNEVIFEWGELKATLEHFQSLEVDVEVMSSAIDCWTYVLNKNEDHRGVDSPLRFFVPIFTLVGTLHSEDGGSSASRSDRFLEHMEDLMKIYPTFDIHKIGVILFPIGADRHYYVIAYNLTKVTWHLIDNQCVSQGMRQYRKRPENLHRNFCNFLMLTDHPKFKEFADLKKPDILEMKWKTEDNVSDCGVFVMRHLETYMGHEEHFNSEFKVESEGQKVQISTLRIRYCYKMLMSNLNSQKDNLYRLATEHQNKKKGAKALEKEFDKEA